MTEEQQIKEALKLLAPPADQRAACEDDIELAVATVAVMGASAIAAAGISKAEKLSVVSYRKALLRAKAARAQLKGILSIFLSDKIDFETPIDLCDQWLSERSAPQYQISAHKILAVKEAYDLLRKWQTEHPPTTTRNGPWCRLAAILFGKKSANLQHHVRAFRSGRQKPGSI